MQLPMKTLIAILPFFLQANAQASGSGTTTRYWDCCKPSCAWSEKATLASGSSPVETCDKKLDPITDPLAVSGCNGGSSYMNPEQSPYAVTDDLAYGYAAVNIAGGSESSWCCACYELTFTSTAIAGKKMIVQATNTGGDLGSNQFDLAIPGGGVGIFNGCDTQFGAPSTGWGNQYGGVSSASSCASFPTALQPGCNFRFGWFEGADNPTVDFKQVECPAALTKSTGCKRSDDSGMPAPEASGTAPVVTSTSAASSSAVVPTSASTEPSTTAPVPEPTTASSKPSTTAPAPEPTSASSEPSTTAPAPEPTTASSKPSTTAPAPEPTSASSEPSTTAPAPIYTSAPEPAKTSSTIAPPASTVTPGDGGEDDDTCDAE